jgi:hypothetical protein
MVLELNSGNHRNLKNRTTKQSSDRACWNTRRSGNLLISLSAEGLARAM